MSMDKLEIMFERQKALQYRLNNHNLPALMPERLPITVTSIVAELGEVLDNVQGWKDWKKNVPPVDQENLVEEVADIFHFVVNLALYAGLDAEDLYQAFLQKNNKNHVRQDQGY